MKNLFIPVLILFIFNVDLFSNPDKFIELKDAVKILEKNDESSENLPYSLSDCYSLEHYDSLYPPPYREMILTKKYENIEELITNLDENLINLIISLVHPRIQCKIYLPVLKYKNRFFLKISLPDLSSYSEYIIELIEPQKVTIELIYRVLSNPVQEIITVE